MPPCACGGADAWAQFKEGSEEGKEFSQLLQKHFPAKFKKVRFPASSGYGIKAVSREGTERLVGAALEYALAHGRKSITLVHKGNIMKCTEGAFRCAQLARSSTGCPGANHVVQ